MNITLTTEQLSGLAYGVAARNAANPTAPPMTDEEFAADLLGVRLDAFEQERVTAARLAMAPIADALIAGSQELRDDVLGYAAQKIAAAQALA